MALLENGAPIASETKTKKERVSFYFPRERIIYETPERDVVRNGKVGKMPARRFLRLSAENADSVMGVWLTSSWITATDRVGANVVVTVSKDGYEYPVYKKDENANRWSICAMMTGQEIAEMVETAKIGEICDSPENRAEWESREEYLARTEKK